MKTNKTENAESPALPQGAVNGLAAKGAAVFNMDLYNSVLSYARNLIYKYRSTILNEFDLVNECLDFPENDKDVLIKKVNKYFFSELRKKEIPFSRFVNKQTGEEIPIETINCKNNEIVPRQANCKNCGILSITRFQIDKRTLCVPKLCTSCKCKKYYKKHREKILLYEKQRRKSPHVKQRRRVSEYNLRNKNREKYRAQSRAEYYRNREKRLASRRERRKLGLIKYCPIKARIRYERWKLKRKGLGVLAAAPFAACH